MRTIEAETMTDTTVITHDESAPVATVGNYAAVRFNALRHGILSKLAVLAHEDRAEFDDLLKSGKVLFGVEIPRGFERGVRRGERTRIDYLPDAGLRIQHGDGAPLALIGIDFTRALLSVWVGPRGVLSGSDAATQQASPGALAD